MAGPFLCASKPLLLKLVVTPEPCPYPAGQMASVRHYMPESPNLEKKATIGIMQAGGRGDIVPMGEGLGSELLMESAVKEIPRRRITVTSSLNEISTDQLGNRAGGRYSVHPQGAAPLPLSLSVRGNYPPPPHRDGRVILPNHIKFRTCSALTPM